MLDYAANAKASFSVETLFTWTEESASQAGITVAEALASALGIDDPDGFWQRVATNLDAERFRLIFVSDVIGSELRRIIEFLNGQMTRTEVLAIESSSTRTRLGNNRRSSRASSATLPRRASPSGLVSLRRSLTARS
jgi:hypothetical protein